MRGGARVTRAGWKGLLTFTVLRKVQLDQGPPIQFLQETELIKINKQPACGGAGATRPEWQAAALSGLTPAQNKGLHPWVSAALALLPDAPRPPCSSEVAPWPLVLLRCRAGPAPQR